MLELMHEASKHDTIINHMRRTMDMSITTNIRIPPNHKTDKCIHGDTHEHTTFCVAWQL